MNLINTKIKVKNLHMKKITPRLRLANLMTRKAPPSKTGDHWPHKHLAIVVVRE